MSTIGPRDVLDRAVRKIEARGSIDTAHRAMQICGQVFRYAVAVGSAERDVTVDLRGALATIPESHFSAITEPHQAGELMRSIFDYTGHPCTVAALKLTPLVFVRPGELRTAEWAEIDLDAAEWRIPGAQDEDEGRTTSFRCRKQAVELLRGVHPISGHGRFVFPSMRTGERPMSENTDQRGVARHGLQQGRSHRARVPGNGAHDHGRSAGRARGPDRTPTWPTP